MSTGIEFTWDGSDLKFWRGAKTEKALTRALRLAGNQAIRGLKRDATAFALSRKALKESDISEDQTLTLPRRTMLRDLAWSLHVRGKPAPMAKFTHRDTRRNSRKGVVVRFGQRTQTIGRAFAVTLRSGHVGIFRRTGDKRLPIEELFSSRLPQKFGPDVMTTYGDKTYRKLQAAFDRGLDREFAKLRRKGDA